jgi:hypothetical protein
VRITFSKEGPSSDQVLSSLTLHHASLHAPHNLYAIADAAAAAVIVAAVAEPEHYVYYGCD